jgi:signal transduction histidine kinase
MRPRGRSIRLRIYFLVTIPLVMMLGLFGYVAYTTITNYVNLDRAPTLTEATAVRSTIFVKLLQAERRAALVYLSNPNSSTRSQYTSSVAATKSGAASFEQAMNAPTVKQAEDAQEAAALAKMIGDVNNMTQLRLGVEAQKISPLAAFAEYTNIVTDEPAVFQAEASSLTNTTAAITGMGLISSVNAREDLDQQDALLAGALASRDLTQQERVAFNQAAGREQDDELLAKSLLSKSEVASLDAAFASPQVQAAQKSFTTVQRAVEAGAPLAAIREQVTGPAWQEMTSTLANANYNGGFAAAGGTLQADAGNARSARNRIYVIGAVSLAGFLLTLLVTILLGRSINRRLTRLRRNATVLATEHLPSVVARLRRGENVDFAAEAPPLRVGTDEIGQVGQAFDMVRQTALRSAVEESRLRTGVNDMFRNLARRNQSLLQRQLTMLDGMERRATDPDVLDDLFKMDHLTTRMRRHAEGLIILSGAAPGRGWSTPVKLIDVMRGAVAEVEDFARVIVTTQSKAALSGAAVTDVIHLLAELIENATTLSPPFTQVRVHGEMVGNGFAIEVEDRGLGMTPMRMGELNERLANPPDVNPANTEQLGLFVVGQLARRHGVKVVLRPSAYGGTTAVVMIPQRLVVDDSTPAITSSATGPQMAATAAATSGAAAAFGAPPFGSSPFGSSGPPGAPMPNGPGRYGTNGSGGPSGFGGLNGSRGPNGSNGSAPRAEARPAAPAAPGIPPDLDNIPISSPPFGVPGPSGNGGGRGPGGLDSGIGGGRRSPEDPVITGVPVTKPSARPPLGGESSPPYSSSSFYGTGSPFDTDGAGSAGSVGGAGSAGGAGAPPGPGSYGSGSYDAASGYGNSGGAGGGYQTQDPGSSGPDDFKGLPRRVRQTNLAPQLRTSRDSGETGVPQTSAPNPADVKNTLSAMQRGWQQGRSQSRRDTEGPNGI